MAFLCLGFIAMFLVLQSEKRNTTWLAIVREETFVTDLHPIYINEAPFCGNYILVKVPKGKSVLVTDADQLTTWVKCTDNTYLRWPTAAKVLPLRSAQPAVL